MLNSLLANAFRNLDATLIPISRVPLMRASPFFYPASFSLHLLTTISGYRAVSSLSFVMVTLSTLLRPGSKSNATAWVMNVLPFRENAL
jgi:hypothetical protein